MSYHEMVSGYKIESSINIRLDDAVKFQKGFGKEKSKKYCGIEKTCKDKNRDDYFPDRLQARVNRRAQKKDRNVRMK